VKLLFASFTQTTLKLDTPSFLQETGSGLSCWYHHSNDISINTQKNTDIIFHHLTALVPRCTKTFLLTRHYTGQGRTRSKV